MSEVTKGKSQTLTELDINSRTVKTSSNLIRAGLAIGIAMSVATAAYAQQGAGQGGYDGCKPTADKKC